MEWMDWEITVRKENADDDDDDMKAAESVVQKKNRRPALALIAERDRVRPSSELQSRQELEYVAWARRIQDETISLPGSLQLLSAETVALWFQMCDVASLWSLVATCRTLRGRSSAFGTASLVEVTAALACRDLYKEMRPQLPASQCVPFGSALLPLIPWQKPLARPSWLARLRCLSRGAAVIVKAVADKSGLSIAAAEITDMGLNELSRRPLNMTQRGHRDRILNGPNRFLTSVSKPLDLIAMNCRGSLIILQRIHDPLVDATEATQRNLVPRQEPAPGEEEFRLVNSDYESQHHQMRARRVGSWDEEDSTAHVSRASSSASSLHPENTDSVHPQQDNVGQTDTSNLQNNTAWTLHNAVQSNQQERQTTPQRNSPSSSVIRRLSGHDALRWDPSTARWHVIPIWSGQTATNKCPALQATNFRRAACIDLLGRLIMTSCECRRAGAERRHRPRPPFHPDRDEFDCRPWRFARRNKFAAGPEEDFAHREEDSGNSATATHNSFRRNFSHHSIQTSHDSEAEPGTDAPISSGHSLDHLGCDAHSWTELPSLIPWRETATIDLVSLDFRPPIGWHPRHVNVQLFQQENSAQLNDCEDQPSVPTVSEINGTPLLHGGHTQRRIVTPVVEYRTQACAWLDRRFRRHQRHKRGSRDDNDDAGGLLLAVSSDGKNSVEVSVSVYVLDEVLGTWVLIAIAPNSFRGYAVTATALGNDLIIASNFNNALCLSLQDLVWRPCRVKRPHQYTSPSHAIDDLLSIDFPESAETRTNPNQYIVRQYIVGPPGQPPAPVFPPHQANPPIAQAHAAQQPLVPGVPAGTRITHLQNSDTLRRFMLLPGPTPNAASAILFTVNLAAVYDLKRDPRTRRVYLQRTACADLSQSSLYDRKGNGPPHWAGVLMPLPL